METPGTLPARCLFRTTPLLPETELRGTPGADHSPAGLLWAPIHGFLPPLAQLVRAWPSPGQGFLSVQAGALAWQGRSSVVVGLELFLPS